MKTELYTPTTINLYGDRKKRLESVCIDANVSMTALLNTFIDALSSGKIVPRPTGYSERRRMDFKSKISIDEQLRLYLMTDDGYTIY